VEKGINENFLMKVRGNESNKKRENEVEIREE
jgi:hypothetical protein